MKAIHLTAYGNPAQNLRMAFCSWVTRITCWPPTNGCCTATPTGNGSWPVPGVDHGTAIAAFGAAVVENGLGHPPTVVQFMILAVSLLIVCSASSGRSSRGLRHISS